MPLVISNEILYDIEIYYSCFNQIPIKRYRNQFTIGMSDSINRGYRYFLKLLFVRNLLDIRKNNLILCVTSF